MKIIPLNDYIFVKKIEGDKISKGGIHIPPAAKDKPTEAEVIAVGPGKWKEDGSGRREPGVKVGDKVLFSQWAGSEIEIEGGKHTFMREDEVLAIIEKGD